MDVILIPLLQVMSIAINLYTWAIIIYAVMSLLVTFQVINSHSPFVRSAFQFLVRLIEPALTPIRKIVPLLGSVDLSPIILILILYFLQGIITNIILKL